MTHEENTSGWDAIDQSMRELYGEQEPKHYGTALPYMLYADIPSVIQAVEHGIEQDGSSTAFLFSAPLHELQFRS